MALAVCLVALSLTLPAQTSSNQPPSISYLQSPKSAVVVEGASTSLSVTASGTPPLSYQWFLDGYEVLDATNRSLSLSKVGAAADGEYRAVVTNLYGAITSRVACVHVIPKPSSLAARILTNGTPRLPYRLFIPPDYTLERQYPLVLFLHGVGERGTDNLLQINANPQGMVFVSYGSQSRESVFFAAPQCPTSNNWADQTMPGRLGALLGALASEFSIDTNRLYITGLSMGGYGCWTLLDLAPNSFAAAVPVCGWRLCSPLRQL